MAASFQRKIGQRQTTQSVRRMGKHAGRAQQFRNEMPNSQKGCEIVAPQCCEKPQGKHRCDDLGRERSLGKNRANFLPRFSLNYITEMLYTTFQHTYLQATAEPRSKVLAKHRLTHHRLWVYVGSGALWPRDLNRPNPWMPRLVHSGWRETSTLNRRIGEASNLGPEAPLKLKLRSANVTSAYANETPTLEQDADIIFLQ